MFNHARLIRKGEREVMKKQDYRRFIFHSTRSDVQVRTDELKEELGAISAEVKDNQRMRNKKRLCALSLTAFGALLFVSAIVLGIFVGLRSSNSILDCIFSRYGIIAIATGAILMISQSRANANYRQLNHDIFTKYGRVRQEIKVLRTVDNFYEEHNFDSHFCPRDEVRKDSNKTLQLMRELDEEILAR